MALFVSGLSHRNAPVELREQLAVDEDKLRDLLRDISSTNVIREAIILSTCNRVEVYAVADVPGEARAAMDSFMADHPRGRHGGLIYDLADFGLDREERRRALRFYVERFAVREER